MSVLMLMAAVFAAPGDLYRCPTDDGHLHVQGVPCSDAREQPLESDSMASNPNLLSQWLRSLDSAPSGTARADASAGVKPARPASRAGAHTDRVDRPSLSRWPLPRSDRNLASCSIQFYQCAAQPGELMDRCVHRIPRCGTRSSGACCQSAYIDRFTTLRASRWSRQSATRVALLGE